VAGDVFDDRVAPGRREIVNSPLRQPTAGSSWRDPCYVLDIGAGTDCWYGSAIKNAVPTPMVDSQVIDPPSS
jgi:hypothetical protein